jgi:signal transduction histidine kinase
LRNRASDALATAGTADDLRDALEYVIQESDDLIKVFNALLMIARMEAGHASENMTFFDASTVVADVAELYEALAEDEGVQLAVQMEPNLNVFGNKELLGQAVSNILDNALKYGRSDRPGNRRSVISVSARHNANYVVIEVADSGKGIPDKDKERVFKRFTRLEASRTKPGFGLGLSLVAAVANLYGGHVKLDDNRPGLIVRLIIPMMTRKVGKVSEVS